MLSRLSLIVVSILLATGAARSQTIGTTGSSASSRATQLPSSGRMGESGSINSQQSASSGTGVATINSSVQVSGTFAGSLPSKTLPDGPVVLSLAEALHRGLTANLGALSANESVRASRANRIQELSTLLPSISANASETLQRVNLAAEGFKFNIPNFSIPTLVGPFAYSQVQGALSQSIYDPVARRNWQASKETERASVLSAKDTRELVILAVGGTYLQTLADLARFESQRAQVDNAQAIYNQAVIRKAAGTNSKIDVVRSLVELQTQQQRLNSRGADFRKQKIALARIIGVPLDREIILSEPLAYTTSAIPDEPAAVHEALTDRADLQAAEAQVEAAQRALSAAHAERLPSISVNGNYGFLGATPASARAVYGVSGALNVPIWQGGRTRGDILQAEATLHTRQAELEDGRVGIEQDVRNALIEIQTATGQVHLAESNRTYANETLSEARDRFAAGVATTVEVVQAQEQVASAESDYISSLFSFDLAKLSLARACGRTEAALPDLLKGDRP